MIYCEYCRSVHDELIKLGVEIGNSYLVYPNTILAIPGGASLSGVQVDGTFQMSLLNREQTWEEHTFEKIESSEFITAYKLISL
jgi:hypothetical protein